MKTNKTKLLFSFMYLSGALFVGSIIFSIVMIVWQLNFYCLLSLIPPGLLAVYYGMIWTKHVRGDVKRAVDDLSYTPKKTILLMFILISVAGYGQDQPIEYIDSVYRGGRIGLNDMTTSTDLTLADTSMLNNLKSSSSSIFRVQEMPPPIITQSSDSGIVTFSTDFDDALDNHLSDLLIQYKNECESTDIYWLYSPDGITVFKTEIKPYGKKIYLIEKKTPTFEDFLNWIEKRKTSKTK